MRKEIVRRVPKQERSIDKRDRIKKAFMYLLNTREDYFTWGTAEIAEKAGISIGTLYAYYSCRENIAEELMDDGNKEPKLSYINALRGGPL